MWPFEQLARRFVRGRPIEPSPEAAKAQQRAAEGMRAELERGKEVTRVTDSIQNAVLRNHLSEAMEHLILRGRPQ
jgi:hypothetical protein